MYYRVNIVSHVHKYFGIVVLGVVQRAMIARAIAAYGQRTCIQFVPKGTYDTDYVYVGKIDG